MWSGISGSGLGSKTFCGQVFRVQVWVPKPIVVGYFGFRFGYQNLMWSGISGIGSGSIPDLVGYLGFGFEFHTRKPIQTRVPDFFRVPFSVVKLIV